MRFIASVDASGRVSWEERDDEGVGVYEMVFLDEDHEALVQGCVCLKEVLALVRVDEGREGGTSERSNVSR